MKKYRKNMVILLCQLTNRADFLCDSLDYDFNGFLPANPELYEKEDWEENNETIERMVNNYVLPELLRAINNLGYSNKTRMLQNIYDVINDIDWEEI